MKTFRNFIFLLIAAAVFTSCSKDEDDKVEPQNNASVNSVMYKSLESSEFPQKVISYIETAYPQATVREMYLKVLSDSEKIYEAELSNGLELYFNTAGDYIGMDDNSQNINTANLPSAITAYISSNHSDASVVKSEKDIEDGREVFEIYLSNGVELYFDLNGSFIKSENDRYPVASSVLPEKITDYLNMNYPNAEILFVEKDYEDGTFVYEVYLDNGMEIDFDLDGNVLSSDDNHISPENLPQKIFDYIAENYPVNAIDKAEIEFEDGIRMYEITLDNEMELYFDMDGNFIKSEQD